MTRRALLTTTTAAAVFAAPARSVTTLFADRATVLPQARVDGDELWIQPADLLRATGFELKKQGACRGEVCIPVPKQLRKDGWFHLTGFLRRAGATAVHDDGVWSLGEIPILRAPWTTQRIAPDFAAPDRKGRAVHLSDFKGKKVLVLTWASW